MKKTKKLLALSLALLILLTPVLGQAASYTDIQGHWSQKYVEEMTAKKVINGYLDGTFRPDTPVAYLEILKLLYGVLDPSMADLVKARADYGPLVDAYKVPEWARDSLVTALAKEVISEGDLKRASDAGMLVNDPGVFPDRKTIAIYYAKALELEPTEDHSVLLHDDKDQLGTYDDPKLGKLEVADYLAALVKAGIFDPKGSVEGNKARFEADRELWRAELAKITKLSYDYKTNPPIEPLEGEFTLEYKLGFTTIFAKDKDGKQVGFDLAETSKLVKGDEEIKFEDLNQGDKLKITYRPVLKGERYEAIKVEVVKDVRELVGRVEKIQPKMDDENKTLLLYELDIKFINYDKDLNLNDDEAINKALKDVDPVSKKLQTKTKVMAYGQEVDGSFIEEDDIILFKTEGEEIISVEVLPTGKKYVSGQLEGYEKTDKSDWLIAKVKLEDGEVHKFAIETKLVNDTKPFGQEGRKRVFTVKRQEIVDIDWIKELDQLKADEAITLEGGKFDSFNFGIDGNWAKFTQKNALDLDLEGFDFQNTHSELSKLKGKKATMKVQPGQDEGLAKISFKKL